MHNVKERVMGFGDMFKKLTVFAVMVTIMATSVAAQSKPWSNTSSLLFTAIGCHTNAFVRVTTRNFSFGCLTYCANMNYVIDGSCSGVGCCQSAIPNGLRVYSLQVDSIVNHSAVSMFNPCSYGFLPFILDWTIGNQTCKQAKKDPNDYACKQNSTCIDREIGPGYLCKCNDGFQGNPYLFNGCQDIDECETLKPCSKSGTCHNTPGSYNCIGLSIGLLFLIAGVWWFCKILQKRKYIKLKQKLFERNGGLLLQKKMSSNEGGLDKAKLFNSKELEIATDQYNENRILGCGGQGVVYKGMLSDGRIVAIKKSKTVNEGYLEQFINEIFILSQIDHRNIVKLLGCCLETEVPLLVYEFIPNGTLFHLIHDQNEEYPSGVASAISYLHSSASIPIYHRDIKSSNILLDEKFRAKVSDFGTSRSISIDQTHLTTQVLGTFGYLDPEYFQSNQFTEKSDVYSFGVVIVELLTGKKAVSTFGSQEKRGLVSYFMSSMEENHLLDIVDAEIGKDDQKDEVVAVAEIAKRCLNLDGRYRPTMKEVAMELERLRS
ncbi:hypothetical protein V6Z12_D10G220900 [Gossypium hirsutum]